MLFHTSFISVYFTFSNDTDRRAVSLQHLVLLLLKLLPCILGYFDIGLIWPKFIILKTGN